MRTTWCADLVQICSADVHTTMQICTQNCMFVPNYEQYFTAILHLLSKYHRLHLQSNKLTYKLTHYAKVDV